MANPGSTTGNSTSTVKIDIVADATKFRDEMKQASSDANKFNKGMQDLKKMGVKQDKDLRKAGKEFNKFNKLAAKESEAHEKRLIGLLKEHNRELDKLAKAGKVESTQFKEKRAEAAKVAALYANIRKERAVIEKEDKPSLLKRIGVGALRTVGGAALALGGAAVGALTSRVGTAGSAASQFHANAINFAGDRSIRSREDLRALMSGGAERGYDPSETLDQAAAVARATGSAKNVGTAQQLARTGMLDVGQATSFMGLQARGGAAQNPEQGKRDLEKIMASAFRTGLDGARFGEYLEGISGLVEGAMSRSAGDVSAVGAAQALGILGGGKQSGLTGVRGANVLGQLEQGFQAGGGEAGQAITLRAMGFGRGTSYYQAMKKMEQGFTGDEGAENLINYVRTVQGMFGGDSEASAEAISKQTGVTRTVVEQVIKRVNDFAGQDPEELKKSIAALTEPTKNLDEQSKEVLSGDLAKQSKINAQRAKDLVNQGEGLADSLNKFQELTNNLIEKAMPALTNAVNKLATGAEQLYDVFFGKGGTTGQRATEFAKEKGIDTATALGESLVARPAMPIGTMVPGPMGPYLEIMTRLFQALIADSKDGKNAVVKAVNSTTQELKNKKGGPGEQLTTRTR